MQLSEFKAWFEGYTEGLEAAPTKAQFDRIKKKVKEISGTPVTYPIYIDRYVEPYRRYLTTWSAAGGTGLGAAGLSAGNDLSVSYSAKGETDTAFNSHAAMYALGKAEAQLAA